MPSELHFRPGARRLLPPQALKRNIDFCSWEYNVGACSQGSHFALLVPWGRRETMALEINGCEQDRGKVSLLSLCCPKVATETRAIHLGFSISGIVRVLLLPFLLEKISNLSISKLVKVNHFTISSNNYQLMASLISSISPTSLPLHYYEANPTWHITS